MRPVFDRNHHTLSPDIPNMEALLRICMEHLKEKQHTLLQPWQLEQYPTYEMNQNTGILRFCKEGGSIAFSIIPIGSWSIEKQSWMWAWANDSLSPSLRAQAQTLRKMGQALPSSIITQELFFADQPLAEALCTLSVEWLDAMGWYACHRQTAVLYLALMSHAPTETLS